MSHISRISDIVVTALDPLRTVLAPLGLTLIEGQTSYATYDGEQPCDHAIRIGTNDKGRSGYIGPWEIGLVPRTAGPGWELAYDSYGLHGQQLEKHAGPRLQTIKRDLATEVIKRDLYRQGYRVTLVPQANGDVRIEAVQ